nr:LOW QUALITY PROTEIN: uncharacterized protein LOC110566968 [Meriones unguiculatus]
MGQTTSKPLDLILTHFGEVKARAHGLSVDVRKGKMMTFCSSEWPTFKVGWPPEGTFHLPTVLAVEEFFRKHEGTQIRRPNWDYNTAEGREPLLVYSQALLAGLKAAARQPTNLAKVYDVRQGTDESPATFLERISEAFRIYTHGDPEKPEYIVDTGVQYSVLLKPEGPVSSKRSWVQGATSMKQYPWTTQRTVDLGKGRVTHSFMVIPECPYPLLGRDLFTKMKAQIHFKSEGPQLLDEKGNPIQVLTLNLASEAKYRLFEEPITPSSDLQTWLSRYPQAWAETGGMRLAKHRPPVFVELKPGADPVRIRQYPMPQEARKGITPHIRKLLAEGALRPCQSAWNTPLLPVKKPHTNDYRPVQDLREVNELIMDIHSTVPNPYTLLSSLSPEQTWYTYTVLDLKDAFFSLLLAPKSQKYFAFEWNDPERGINGQLTWTRLPQGFKNSPTIFDEALHEDLGEYQKENLDITLTQYVDDLLIAAGSEQACLEGTQRLLQTLGDLGY